MFQKIKNATLLLLIVVVVAGVWRYVSVWRDLDAKIEEANRARQELEQHRADLQTKVDGLTMRQEELDATIASNRREISEREKDIAALREELAQTNLQLVVETSDQRIADDFKEAFDLSDANVKVISYAEPTRSGRLFTNTFLAMPVDIAKLPIAAKNTEVACQAEVGLREEITQLNDEVVELTEQKLVLEREKTQAWSDGYQQAYDMYMDINEMYLELLKTPPKVDLAPRWLQFVGGLASGAVLCSL